MENKSGNSFAVFRLPHSKKIEQIQGNCIITSLDFLNTQEPSFIVGPFHDPREPLLAISFHEIQEFEGFEKLPFHSHESENVQHGKDSYTQLVNTAISVIEQGELHKVVLANQRVISAGHFHLPTFFEQIEKAYPSAFVYCLSSPQTGTWVGASPEPLLRGDSENMCTVAMAGTLRPDQTEEWGDKEKEEQYIVEAYIEDKLKQLKGLYTKNGPFTYTSGSLRHLRTEFNFQIPASNKQLAALVQALHPTPAVGGIPREKAIQFIQEKEGFKRNLYAGFLGILQANQLDLFVNLRCLELQKQNLILFAGAGITIDSQAESEWLETQQKMLTLEKFLSH